MQRPEEHPMLLMKLRIQRVNKKELLRMMKTVRQILDDYAPNGADYNMYVEIHTLLSSALHLRI